ncbi:hypothetical protein BDY21DRAFT_325072 [Lineolata rhizophorae]|uniref:Methyltransferase-domain-containing protein n=1 Tax=Lineolata rhizophorae TaxID=578093 RepID=A0A6A6NTT1_9PEZI|nr:hypothetical protein BDY21DRAFT_325072 [Lineolata rhizophorae]
MEFAISAALGDEVSDPSEEAFWLLSQSIPSQDLGFVDPRAAEISFSVADRDLTIQQSPALLSSDRKQGTTGAVVWKVTPLVAEWAASPERLLFRLGALGPAKTVLELGCGVAGVLGLALAPSVGKYVATDQNYVLRLLRENIALNNGDEEASTTTTNKHQHRHGKGNTKKEAGHHREWKPSRGTGNFGTIEVIPLDWETDDVSFFTDIGCSSSKGVDVLIACDCIYNESLVEPFVTTCRDICRLRSNQVHDNESSEEPTLCVVASQIRSWEVMDAFLVEFHRWFRLWRVPDRQLPESLQENSGFSVHVGILRR